MTFSPSRLARLIEFQCDNPLRKAPIPAQSRGVWGNADNRTDGLSLREVVGQCGSSRTIAGLKSLIYEDRNLLRTFVFLETVTEVLFAC